MTQKKKIEKSNLKIKKIPKKYFQWKKTQNSIKNNFFLKTTK